MADKPQETELKAKDFVYITKAAAKLFPDLKGSMPDGGIIEEVVNGVAKVVVVKIHKININFLTTPTDPEAYDGLPD